MAMQEINLTPKKKGGKGGLLGTIIGGALGAIAGAFSAGTAAAPAAMAGSALAGIGTGAGIGGVAGGAIDPAKVEERNAVAGLDTAAREYPEVQAADLEEASLALDTLPGVPDQERTSLKQNFAQAKERALLAGSAMERLRGRRV